MKMNVDQQSCDKMCKFIVLSRGENGTFGGLKWFEK